MIDVFVRMAATPVMAGVVAESVLWASGVDPAASRHQVVTLFGDPSVTHLAWALAAAYRGSPDSVWRIAEDGSAVAAELSLASSVLREDAAVLVSTNGPQLRTAIAHLTSVRDQEEHSPAIRVPISRPFAGDLDSDSMLAMLREAEGEVDADVLEDDLAA